MFELTANNFHVKFKAQSTSRSPIKPKISKKKGVNKEKCFRPTQNVPYTIKNFESLDTNKFCFLVVCFPKHIYILTVNEN